MAFIEKLSIQGFRSFGPDDTDRQTMSFVTKAADGEGVWPLVLILGQNGCGKTTIIECLRYIATGDCPPGSYSGRLFVHDPKMARMSKILATVKMKFRGADGKHYIVTRAIEATQKPKLLSIQTKDSTFKDSDANNVISGKCADVEALTLLKLGVSKPILNYVIFCHQEDSNWPLEEGSKVKDKFDEIFDSARYKKCLENIKDVRKLHMEQEKLEKKDVDYLSEMKNMADEKKRELDRKTRDKEALEQEVESILQRLKPLEDKLREMTQAETSYSDIIKAKTQADTCKEQSVKYMRQLNDRLGKEIISDSVSDQEIEGLKKKMTVEASQAARDVGATAKEIKEAQEAIRDDEGNLRLSSASLGEFKAKRAAHEDNKKGLKDMLELLTRSIDGVEATDATVDDEDALEDVIRAVRRNWEKLEQKTKRTTEEANAASDQQSRKVVEEEKAEALLENQKKQNAKLLSDSKQEIAKISGILRNCEDAVEKLQELDKTLSKKKTELESVSSTEDVGKLKQQVTEKKKELADAERKESALREEKAIFDEHQKSIREVEMRQSDKADQEAKVDKIILRKKRQLDMIFGKGGMPDRDRVRDEFTRRFASIAQDKKTTEEEGQKLCQEREVKLERRRQLATDVDEREARVKAIRNEMSDVMIGSFSNGELEQVDLEEELHKAKDEVANIRKELQVKEANAFSFAELIKSIDDSVSSGKPNCPTCHRAFKLKDEAESMKRDLQDIIDEIPGKVASIKQKLKRTTEKQEKLQDLLPKKRQLDEYVAEVTSKKSEIQALDKDLKALARDVDSNERRLEEIAGEHSACEAVREDVFALDRLNSEIKSLEEKISESKSAHSGSLDSLQFRSIEEFRQEETKLARKISGCRKSIDIVQGKISNFEAKTIQLERDINSLTQQKLHIEREQQESSALEKKRSELEEKTRSILEQQKDVNAKIDAINDNISELRKELNKVKSAGAAAVESARKEAEDAKTAHSSLEATIGKIRDYEGSNNDKKLDGILSKIRELTERKSEREDKCRQLEEKKARLQKVVDEQVQSQRMIDDNLALRNHRREQLEYEKESKRCQEQLKLLDYDELMKKKKSVGSEYTSLNAMCNTKRGKLSEMENSLSELTRELEKEKFKNAENLYRSKVTAVKVRQHVIADLNKYWIALDWAIMRFHKERMEVINRIIRELWRTTYKGNDIDYIEIKTEDTDTKSAGADKRKNYNYKVVMVKNSTEMDMRGRCSAGQKVLASIIIRLALAETFSAECGVIALDEPTTNLDNDNIESLAEALAQIVERRSNRNTKSNHFQLIVITHDNDLIEMLGRRVQNQESYYRVHRNDRGLSEIRRMNIL